MSFLRFGSKKVLTKEQKDQARGISSALRVANITPINILSLVGNLDLLDDETLLLISESQSPQARQASEVLRKRQ